MDEIKDRIFEMLFIWDFEYLELLSAFAAIGWSITFFVTPDLFSISGAYTAMERIISQEHMWGILSLVLGVTQLTLVYVNRYRNLAVRRAVTFVITAFWLFIASLFYMSRNTLTTSTMTYLLIAISSCWAYIRLSLRYRRFNG